ncbi:MAG TPA: TaqI-like C-terminal specificity domain-containing protein, partial [Planctomycetota bacterium]|nr:TaqI-like C-terminal specificity domain-containing protein [Planctomycetota bacterium]
LVARIEATSVPITSWMEVRDGVNPGPRSFRDRIVLAAPDSTDASVRPMIVGGDIEPFRVKPSTRWIRHNPRLLTPAIRKQGASFRAPELFSGPKLVSRQTASHPIAGLDLDCRSAINSVHIMIPAETLGFDTQPARALLLILGCLNATPLTWYYRQRWMENRRVFPQVHISSLRQLPIPAAFREAAAAAQLAQAAGAAAGAADARENLHTWLNQAGVELAPDTNVAQARRQVDRQLLAAWRITPEEWEQAA